MTYAELISEFLKKIAEMKKENPAYKQPGDGSGGVCDCIGLIIGAIRRMGLKWTGIHGSNYAARYQTVDLSEIHSADELELGDVVYKACAKGNTGHKWDLPSRYQKGGKYYDGNLLDYYHAGAVTQVNPMRITHMTSPHMKVDTKLGGWNWHGKAKPIWNAASEKPSVQPVTPEPPEDDLPSEGSMAVVTSENGKPVKMREYPSRSCRTWENLPVGTRVKILEPGEEWARIQYGKRKWYMMAKFLDIIGDGKGQY